MLDVGHGTGLWVFEFAQTNRNADVFGIDLRRGIPQREIAADPGCPPITNAVFHAPVDFLQPNWPFALASYDLIHMGRMCGSVPDWMALYQTVSR